MDGDIILPVMCPLLICSFWQESHIRNATILCIRNIESISSSILDSSIRKTGPFLWASASDQDGPGSIHDVFLVYGLTEGCLKSATVPESQSCSLSLCLHSVQRSSCWGWNSIEQAIPGFSLESGQAIRICEYRVPKKPEAFLCQQQRREAARLDSPLPSPSDEQG